MKFAEHYLEETKSEFPTLYHGTSSDALVKSKRFITADVYLTYDKEESKGYAAGKHLGGAGGENNYVLSVLAEPGKIYDGQDDVDKIIMEEHEKFDDLDELMNWARDEGYSYVTFEHPSFSKDDYHKVVVSLRPNKDLKILGVEKT